MPPRGEQIEISSLAALEEGLLTGKQGRAIAPAYGNENDTRTTQTGILRSEPASVRRVEFVWRATVKDWLGMGVKNVSEQRSRSLEVSIISRTLDIGTMGSGRILWF